MDSRTEMPEYGADPAPSSNSEYLRALKRNETHAPPDPAPATALVPANSHESQPNSVPAGEKRRNPRYKCEGSAEFRTQGIDVRTWATVTDISRSGCYVEMQATSPRDTRVDMVIEVKGIRVQVKGTVRTSYPLLGMGITFTDITEPATRARAKRNLGNFRRSRSADDHRSRRRPECHREVLSDQSCAVARGLHRVAGRKPEP